METDRRLLTRVALRNYKSIAACDVSPAQLAFLVGPNGSGKSNFLDALRFVADAVRFSLDHALRDRGGISEVRRRSGGHPNHFGIRVDLGLAESSVSYAFTVGAKPRGGYEVQREQCRVSRYDGGGRHYYKVARGRVVDSTVSPAPAAADDRLYLVNVSGVEAFRPVYDALVGMGFYNLNPEAIRELQSPDPGDLLKRDGSNIASVLGSLGARSPRLKQRIEEYLGKVVSGVSGVDDRSVGPKETLEFKQEVRGARHPWRGSSLHCRRAPSDESTAAGSEGLRFAAGTAPVVRRRSVNDAQDRGHRRGPRRGRGGSDLDAARRTAPSFDKMWREVHSLLVGR